MASRFRDSFPIFLVADVKRSVEFYRDRLGFELMYTFPSAESPQFASLAIEGGKLALGAGDRAIDSGSASIWVYTDDVDASVAELRDAGVTVVTEPADQPWGERAATVADPDGYAIHIGAPT